jgi:hypothetical protein
MGLWSPSISLERTAGSCRSSLWETAAAYEPVNVAVQEAFGSLDVIRLDCGVGQSAGIGFHTALRQARTFTWTYPFPPLFSYWIARYENQRGSQLRKRPMSVSVSREVSAKETWHQWTSCSTPAGTPAFSRTSTAYH